MLAGTEQNAFETGYYYLNAAITILRLGGLLMRTMLSPERADRYKAKVLNSKVFSSYNGTYHLITCFGFLCWLWGKSVFV